MTKVEELEAIGLAKELAELAGNVGIELPLLTIEGVLEDEAIDGDEDWKPEGLVLWLVVTLVEEDSELDGPIL